MFTDALELAVKLTHQEGSIFVPGGNVKSWSLDLHSWGFNAKVVFLLSLEMEQDALLKNFTSPELLRVELSVKPHITPDGLTVEPVLARGLATRKALLAEQAIVNGPLKDNMLLYRLYEVEFADAAQVVWKWQRPFDLMIDKSVKELILAHKSPMVNLRCDWKLLEKKWPSLCLSLGRETEGITFYDFILWYTASHNGVFAYDVVTDTYSLSAEKPSSNKSRAMPRQWVSSVRIDFPEPPRHAVRILNADAEDSRQQLIENTHAVEGVYRDYLKRFPVPAEFDQRHQLEQTRLIIPGHELVLDFSQYPLMTTYAIGDLIRLEGGMWGDALFTYSKKYRVRSLHFDARAVEQDFTSDHNQSFNRFSMDMRSVLETSEEKRAALPAYAVPRYPVFVEGTVVSEQGEEQSLTYQYYEDADTSRIHYKVTIPLWNNQVLVVPFAPILHSGHFYFPAYKRARALVALDFQEARIVQWLDWRDDARLAADTQGNRILMGWTPDSRTAISHTYVNNLPVFAMERLAENDTESIIMSEGNLVIQTLEK